jgi:hypothetical protein
MHSESEVRSHSPKVQEIAKTIRITGWMAFWVQLAFAVVSSLALLFAATGRGFTNQPSRGLGAGIFWAILGIIILFFSIYWDFLYMRKGRLLANPNPVLHPSKADTIRAIKVGVVASLIGILLTLFGLGSTVGVLVAKSISQPPGVAITDPNKIIRALDVFVLVANVNGVAGNFVGLLASLWLFIRIDQNH